MGVNSRQKFRSCQSILISDENIKGATPYIAKGNGKSTQ